MAPAALLALALLADVKTAAPGQGFTPPIRVKSASPVYPAKERKEGITGVVVLDILIDEEGNVADTDVKSSPGEPFTKAAIACVKKWKFRPGTANGVPRFFRQTVTIDFRLKTSTPAPEAAAPPATPATPPSKSPAAPK